MAKLPEKIIIEAQNIDKVQTMIELLTKYKDELPVELMDSLNELADCEACEYGVNNLPILGVSPHNVTCHVDGNEVKGVVSANIILKRLTVYLKRWEGEERAECNENGFIESYKYPDNFIMKDSAGNELLGWG